MYEYMYVFAYTYLFIYIYIYVYIHNMYIYNVWAPFCNRHAKTFEMQPQADKRSLNCSQHTPFCIHTRAYMYIYIYIYT